MACCIVEKRFGADVKSRNSLRFDLTSKCKSNSIGRTDYTHVYEGRGRWTSARAAGVCAHNRVQLTLVRTIKYTRELWSIFVRKISKYYTRTFKQIIFILFISGPPAPIDHPPPPPSRDPFSRIYILLLYII